jgi:general secretion pathway protein N
MTAPLSRSQIMLGILCLVLLTALAYESGLAPAAADVPAVRRQARDTAAPLALAPPPPPIESFAVIDDRPLFNPSRKPVAAPAAAALAAAPPPPPSDVVLIGIIIDGVQRLALLHTPASPLSISATVGATVGGWRIAAIEPDHIVLRSGATEFLLNLNSSRPASAQPSPMAPPPQEPATSTNP